LLLDVATTCFIQSVFESIELNANAYIYVCVCVCWRN